MLFASRRREPGRNRWLPVKIGLFVLAAVVGLVGMSLGERRLVASALVLAIAGFLLRFAPPADHEDE